MSTYYDRVLPLLTEEPKTIETLLEELQLPDYKKTYVVAALKKAIEKGKATKIVNPDEKRQYMGHTYVSR
ncbi:MAG: hypothetical protein KGL39_52055 [Patescibacteria group bacterium]|nr:hypothetical protein [Patescibacteria group bacterium]